MLEETVVTKYKAVDTLGMWVEQASINNDGNVRANNDVMYCSEYLTIEKYAIDYTIKLSDRTEGNGFFVAIAFYNSSKGWISRNNYVSGTRILSTPIPTNAVFFRLNLVYKVNGSALPAILTNFPLDELDLCYAEQTGGLVSSIEQLQTDVETLQGMSVPPDTMDLPVSYVSSSMKTPGQGLAKVGNNFVISQAGTDSYDSAGSTVKIQVYDSSFANIGFMWHNLGHGSNICYNPTYDAFLMGNGVANVSPRLDILLNASANVRSAIDGNEPEYLFGGSNVMSIYLTKNGTELLAGADGALWCVGGNDRLVFISLRRSSDKARVFYLAMLGVGSTDFSQDSAGYGTFVSGKSDSELNGTLKILKEYQPISDSINSTQGVTYDKGKLIVSYSTTACLLCKLALYDAGYKITDKYKVAFYNANGTEATCEPEGVEKVSDNHYYCATTKGVIDFYC